MSLISDREAQRLALLERAGLAAAERHPLPGDASTRRYERLITPGGAALMLMDQPPAAESPPCAPDWTPEHRRAAGWNALARLSAGRVEAFAAVAEHLRAVGLSAPRIIAVDAPAGLAVIEDFGDDLFARVIAAGQPERPLYLAAVEALAALHAAGPPPATLGGPGGDWPVLTHDATALLGGAELFVDWLPKLNPALQFDAAARDEWTAAWSPVAAAGEAGARVLAHRDYHAENLIWLPGRAGPARVGMIDFQDAVLAHPAWDLHSLLQDARRDVPPEIEAIGLDRYLEITGVEAEPFRRDYAALAALNEARILGIFARLVVRDGKARYRAFMPRMWRHLEQNLKRPELSELRGWFDRHVPAEARS